MIPALIQDQLQTFYDLNVSYKIDDFLITDHRLADALDNGPMRRNTAEKLLIMEDANGLNISLYLAEELLTFLNSHNPFDRLDESNINEFCTVLEGVSHFLYLSWNATYDRPICQLELELQAEVDKFVSINLLHRQQGKTENWRELIKILFQRCRFDPRLEGESLNRYLAANDNASRYCTLLENRGPGIIDHTEYVRELRRFYRIRHRQKLHWCGQPTPYPGP